MRRTNCKQWRLAIVISLVFITFAAFAALAEATRSNGPDSPGAGPNKDHRTAAFVAALDADGFTVDEGTVELTDILYAVNDLFIDSGAGANAGQFYKRWAVPALPGQTGTPPFLFRLAPDEAVVYVGKTPPECDYFSFCAFLWSRSYPDSYLPTGDWLFASVGDPLNNAWIKTEGQGNPSQKNTIIVLTADEGVYERIKEAAGSANFPVSMVNPLVLPSNVLRLGTDTKSDSLFVLVRTANIVSPAQEQRYLADSEWARLYRVTPRVPPVLQPFAQPPWRERAWKNEEELVPGLQAGLERLKQAILAKTPCVQARPLESIKAVPDSKDVLLDDPTLPAYRKNVMGESPDTPYRMSAENGEPANFLLGNDDMVVVYGVNHAATKISTYSSFAVYGEWYLNHLPLQPGDPRFMFGAGDPMWNGVAGITDQEYAGSAEQYIPHDPMARYLYAVQVVRKARAAARDPYRVVVPEFGDSEAAPFYPDVIPLDKPARIGYRAYLNPATGAGPAYEDIIPDRAIWFKLR
jgi:hypothetical protein